MKRKHVIPVFLFLCLLCSCTRGNYTAITADENNGDAIFSMTFTQFNGYKERVLNISSPTDVRIQADISSGSVDIAIKDESHNGYYDSGVVSTAVNDTVHLTTPGRYVIHVGGQDAYGSYTVTWQEVEQ